MTVWVVMIHRMTDDIVFGVYGTEGAARKGVRDAHEDDLSYNGDVSVKSYPVIVEEG